MIYDGVTYYTSIFSITVECPDITPATWSPADPVEYTVSDTESELTKMFDVSDYVDQPSANDACKLTVTIK